jgi:hypothetical protein
MQEFQQAGQTQKLMSDTEAQELLRLYMHKTGGATQISTADVAEAIRLPEIEVEALLAELRTEKLVATSVKPARRRKVRDVIVACIAALILLVAGLAIFRSAVVSAKPRTDYFIVGNGHTIDIPSNVQMRDAEHNGDLIATITEFADRQLTPTGAVTTSSQPDTLKQIQSGNWDAAGIEHVSIDVADGRFTTSTSLPYYRGGEPGVSRACQIERQSRISWALHDLEQQTRISP